jgi:hypothetical protein
LLAHATVELALMGIALMGMTLKSGSRFLH